MSTDAMISINELNLEYYKAQKEKQDAVIGGSYRYPGSGRKFVLKEIRPFSNVFECGHWCTDNVFADLARIRTSTEIGSIQLSLFDPGVANGNQ